jgi:hypothetical protein
MVDVGAPAAADSDARVGGMGIRFQHQAGSQGPNPALIADLVETFAADDG